MNKPVGVRTLIAIALFLACHEVSAQAAGGPIFFEPTYAYTGRVGADFSHGGDLGGWALTGGGSYQISSGNCNRASIAGEVGAWRQPGGESTRLVLGGNAQVLLNGCPTPTTVSQITFRAVVGGAVAKLPGEAKDRLTAGLGVGYEVEAPIAHLEPWLLPHIVRYEPLGQREKLLRPAIAAGVNIGLSGRFGLRLGVECCQGGVAAAYGLSAWF